MKKHDTVTRNLADILAAITADLQDHPQTAQDAVAEIQALGQDLKAATQKAIGLVQYGLLLVDQVMDFLEHGGGTRELLPGSPPAEQIRRIAGKFQE